MRKKRKPFVSIFLKRVESTPILTVTMGTIACIIAEKIRSFAFEPLFNGKSASDRTLSFAKNLKDYERTLVFSNSPLEKSENCTNFIDPEWNLASVLTVLQKEVKPKDTIAWFFLDAPFLDDALARKLYDAHHSYKADYSFADGYPYGLSIEYFQGNIVGVFIELSKKISNVLSRDVLFTLVQKDINAFDIETLISPKDMRLYRASLICDSKRNTEVCKRLMHELQKDEELSFNEEAICSYIEENRSVLQAFPAYLQVQISDSCPQSCSLCPYPKLNPLHRESKAFMSLENYKKLMKNAFELCNDLTVSISLWGEALLHPELYEIICETLKYPDFTLVIETSGIGIDAEILDKILSLNSKRINWILSLDAKDEENYTRLRGEGYAKALAFAELLLAKSKDTFYIQALRSTESDSGLEEFFRFWKTKTDNVIIQKYDSFAHFLSDKLVCDLSPITRNPCRHLERELSVLIDGSVPLCKDDVLKTVVLGNVFTTSLEEIWNKNKKLFKEQCGGSESKICADCDEYYTYNF